MKKDRLFISALLFSAAWHIFWISAVSVVAVPKTMEKAKFSRVSFLGPILDKGMFKISVEPLERTALEKNYLAGIAGLYEKLTDGRTRDNRAEANLDEGASSADNEDLSGIIIAAIDTRKIEPGRDMD